MSSSYNTYVSAFFALKNNPGGEAPLPKNVNADDASAEVLGSMDLGIDNCLAEESLL